MEEKNLKRYEKCPYCGGTVYEVRTYMKGNIPTIRNFSDNKEQDNPNRYSQLMEVYKPDFIYCANPKCGRRLCKVSEFDFGESNEKEK